MPVTPAAVAASLHFELAPDTPPKTPLYEYVEVVTKTFFASAVVGVGVGVGLGVGVCPGV